MAILREASPMATSATRQPPMEVGQSSLTSKHPTQTSTNPSLIPNYANLLQLQALNALMHLTNVNLKPLEYLHDEPMVRWKKTKVQQSIVQQGLHLVVMGNVSYGKPGIQELRKVNPIQCG